MNTTVLKEKDRVWLEGVSGWFVGDRESSVHAAQVAVMDAYGEDISYAYILGVSGLAFRMQVSKDGLCPSSPHSSCGYQCVARSVQALPYKVQVFEVPADDADKVKEARRAVVASIDRGVPVQYGSEEDGVIVGYQKHGDEWICFHPMRVGGKKTFVETNWPWGIAVYTGSKTGVPTKRELALGALKQAVEMAEIKEAGDYHLGWAAWDAYLQRLKTLQQVSEKTKNDDMLGNSWIYECLTQYRRAAVTYLRDIAGEFEEDVTHHLLKAADIYEKLANEVLKDYAHGLLTIAPLPWSLKKGEVWTAVMRENQIKYAYCLNRKK